MAKKKKSGRKVSYSFLSMGGRRFVPLTEDVLKRLPENEIRNIKKMADYTHEDLRKVTKEDWYELYAMADIGSMLSSKVAIRAVDITSGKAAEAFEGSLINDYYRKLNTMGKEDIALEFLAVAKELKKTDYSTFELLVAELPRLHHPGSDSTTTNSKKHDDDYRMSDDERLERVEELLEKYEKELHVDIEELKKKYASSGEE